MRILIIEDDINKMQGIASELRGILENVQITEARSYQSGVSKLMQTQFDLLLLDMSLPIFDISPEEEGFQIDPFSGSNILAEMLRKNVIVPTVIITMFETFGDGVDLMTLEELDKELSDKYATIYQGAIYYNSSEVNWKESLTKLIKELV